MSTLGKVLVVLITLTMAVWIFLAAVVTQHHMNWSKRLNEVTAEVKALEAELPPIQEDIFKATDAANQVQVTLENSRRNYRAELAMAQKTESDTKEALDRYTLQLKSATDSANAAKARQEVRLQERTDFEKKIAQEEAGVRELMAENEKLRAQLADLQKTFISTLAENKSYVDRLKNAASTKSATSGNKPRVKLVH